MARDVFPEGAGRPSGSTSKSFPQQSQRLSVLAKSYTEDTLETLVEDARNGRTNAARVSGANALFGRAYDKAAVKEERETVDIPAVIIQLTSPSRRTIAPLRSGRCLSWQTFKCAIEKRLIGFPLI